MPSTRTVIASTSAAALLGLGAVAGPALAAPNNTDQRGLVNVALTETVVQAPIALAANICGVAVNVLATSTATAPVDCTAEGVATASRDRGGDSNNTRQRGLVNVAVTDTTVQVPIAVAANACGVTINVLSALLAQGPVSCDAGAVSDAS